MDARRNWIICILLFLALGVTGLTVRPLVVPDEPRYGIIPAEMVDTGNWLALRMAGFVYYEKPPLGYWLTAASMTVFGHNAFAIRLPSVLATLVVALVAAWMAVRITGRRQDGPLAFMVQATTLAPLIIGTVALLDPPFAAFVALSMGALYCGCTSIGRVRAGWLALAGVAAGFAFLTKGLLAFAIPGVSALLFLAWERRWKDMLTMPWIPLGAAAITIAPFAWMIHRAEPGFWEYFIVVEHFRRVASPDSNQHPEPWWQFLVVFPIGALLWTLAWPNAWKGLRDATEWRSGMRFMAAWVIAPITLLSLSSGKLPTYVLPLFAPVAVLVAIGLLRARAAERVMPDRLALFARTLVRIAAVASFIIAIAGGRRFGIPVLWESGEALRFTYIGAALLLWAQLDVWSWKAADPRTWLLRTALAPVPVLLAIQFLYPEAALSAVKHPWPFLQRHAEELRSVNVLVTSAAPAHALSWVTGRRDFVIAGSPSEFDNELNLPQEESRKIEWSTVAAKVLATKALAPAQSIAVLGSTDELERLAQTPGIPAPDARETVGSITIMHWR